MKVIFSSILLFQLMLSFAQSFNVDAYYIYNYNYKSEHVKLSYNEYTETVEFTDYGLNKTFSHPVKFKNSNYDKYGNYVMFYMSDIIKYVESNSNDKTMVGHYGFLFKDKGSKPIGFVMKNSLTGRKQILYLTKEGKKHFETFD